MSRGCIVGTGLRFRSVSLRESSSTCGTRRAARGKLACQAGWIVSVTMALAASPVHAAVVSTFDDSTEGWQKLPGSDASSAVVWVATGGNINGYVQYNETGAGFTDYVSAPAAFLGDKSIYYGGTLRFDIRINLAPVAVPETAKLTGNGLTLAVQLAPPSPANTWHHRSVALTENGGWINTTTGLAPTQAQLLSVLANLTALHLRTDYVSGSEQVSFDNIALYPPSVCVSPFLDDFDDGILDASMIVPSGGCSIVTEINGRLELFTPAGCAGTAGIFMVPSARVCGDFDVRVDFDAVTFPTPTSGGFRALQLLLRRASDDSLVGVIERLARSGTNNCVPFLFDYKAYTPTTTTDDCQTPHAGAGGTSGRLRITRQGTFLRFYFWDAASSRWHMLLRTSGTTDDLYVRLGSGRTGTAVNDPQLVAFDNLSIQPLGDGDIDGDDVPDTVDNCPHTPNADQLDSDCNGTGDSCDSTPCDSLPAGAVGWWDADAGFDTQAGDLLGNHHANLVNGAWRGPGLVGRAFHFDGVNDHVEIPDHPNLKPPHVTVEAWVRFDRLVSQTASSTGLQYIVFKKNTRAGQFEGYALYKGGGNNFVFLVTSSAGLQAGVGSTIVAQTGVWYHVAGTYDGSQSRLYVNGSLQGTITPGFPLNYGTRPVFIGTTGESFDGRLCGSVDEVRIYNRALSGAEVAASFGAGGGGLCKDAFRDTDVDGYSDEVDNCPYAYNPDQLDVNGNGVGDVCETLLCNQPPMCDLGGPYSATCSGARVTVQLDGGASTDLDGPQPLDYFWTTNCEGAEFDDAHSAAPLLTFPVGGCPASCTVTLTVSDGDLESTCSATITIAADAPLQYLQPVNENARIIIAPSGSISTNVEFSNTGQCPVAVTGLLVSGDFNNPAIAVGAGAPSTPRTVCPGETVSIPVSIATANAIAGTYMALVGLIRDGEPITAGLEIVVSDELRPDIAVATPVILGDLGGSPPLLNGAQGFTVSAAVSNVGSSAASAFTVQFLAVVDGQEQLLGTAGVGGLASGASTVAHTYVAGATLPVGFHVVRVQVSQLPPEGDLSSANNSAATFFQLGSLPVTGAAIIVSGSAKQGCIGPIVNVSGRADYLLVSTTGSLLNFPVQGARVTVTVLDSAGTVVSTTSTVHTLTTGSYNQPIHRPAPGTYTVRVEVTDFSLTGEAEFSLTVLGAFECQPPTPAPPPPAPPPSLSLDLWVCGDDIEVFHADVDGTCGNVPAESPVAGEPLCIRASVSYYANVGGQPAPSLFAQPVSVYAHLHDSVSGAFQKTLIHQEALTFTGSGSLPIQFTWTPPTDGEHVIEVRWEPTIGQYTANDSATRGVAVGSALPQTPIAVAVNAGGCYGAIGISGRADYVSEAGPRIPVGCGQVTARVLNESGAELPSTGGSARTNAGGFYSTTLFAATPAPGTYRVVVEVSDGTLLGTGQHEYNCVVVSHDPAAPLPPPPPPGPPPFFGDAYIFAEHIVFLGDATCSTGLLRNPEPGENVSLHATGYYKQSGPQQPHEVTLVATEYIPVGDALVAVPIGSVGPLPLPPGGGTVGACIPWTPASYGTRIVQVLLEPDFVQYTLNDAATRAITVGSAACELELGAARIELIAGQSDALAVHAGHSGTATPTLELTLKALPPATSLPAGLTVVIDPHAETTSPFDALLTLHTDASLAPGRYPLAVLGVGDVCTTLATFTLIVYPPNRAPTLACELATVTAECESPNGAVISLGANVADEDGDELTVTWRVNGEVVQSDVVPAGESFAANLTMNRAYAAGPHVVSATVDDGQAAPVTCETDVTVADTMGPVIDLAGDSIITLECSEDPYTDAGAVAFDACGGTVPVLIGGDAVDLSTPGTYVVTFDAVDSGGNAPETVTRIVIVEPQTPMATAGDDQSVPEGSFVVLDASATSDILCGTPEFRWTQVGGSLVALDVSDPVRPAFTAPQVPMGGETLTFQLVVHNEPRSSDPDVVNVHVINVNNVPVALADDLCGAHAVAEAGTATLDGSHSYDVDDEPLTYSWVQLGGVPVALNNADTAVASFTTPLVGPGGELLSFELTVSDGEVSASRSLVVCIVNLNHAPAADAGPAQTVAEGAAVMLDANASVDQDGDTLLYSWMQVNGPTVTLAGDDTPTPSFTAPQVGTAGATLVFRVTVADGNGGIDTAEVTITVQDAAGPPECDLAQPSKGELWPPNHKLVPVTITAVTHGSNQAVSITILSVTQDEPINGLGDGDTAPDAVIQGSTVLLRAERAGGGNGRVYRITFAAIDGSGGACIGMVAVRVPHDKGKNTSPAIDDGPLFNSLGP